MKKCLLLLFFISIYGILYAQQTKPKIHYLETTTDTIYGNCQSFGFSQTICPCKQVIKIDEYFHVRKRLFYKKRRVYGYWVSEQSSRTYHDGSFIVNGNRMIPHMVTEKTDVWNFYLKSDEIVFYPSNDKE